MGADSAIQVHCYQDFTEEIRHLGELSACATGFDLNLAWFRHLSDNALNSGERLFLWHAQDSSGDLLLPTMAPVAELRSYRRLVALGNYYTSEFAPIGQVADRTASVSAICRRIAQNRPNWDVIDLRPLNPYDRDFQTLWNALGSSGYHPYRYFCFGNWYLPAEKLTFDAYWTTRPKALRNTVKRKGKAFAKGGRGRLEIITGGAGLEAAIRIYSAIYAASWKKPEPHPEFMPGLIRLAAQRGWLRMGLAWYDHRAVAAQVWLVVNNRAAIYKLAYDESDARLSAGTLLTAHLMQQVLDADKVLEVDYLIGDEPYKRDWMSHRRERWGIVAYNSRTIRGRIGSAMQSIGEWRRKLLLKFASWQFVGD